MARHRMSRCGRRGGFSLLELAIVLGTVVLTASILLPVVALTRNAGRTRSCQQNMSFASRGFFGFAADHELRFPQRAMAENYPVPGSTTSLNWAGILNTEYYRPDVPFPTPSAGPLILLWGSTTGAPSSSKYTTCPAFKSWNSPPSGSNMYARPWVMNLNAVGGPNWGSNPPWGPYGKAIANPQSINPLYTQYYLGARIDLFVNPSRKFLLWDSERATDSSAGVWPGGIVYLNADPAYPPWSGSSGLWAFRHNLPSSPAKYQQEARAMILYIDGQARAVNTSVRVLDSQFCSPS